MEQHCLRVAAVVVDAVLLNWDASEGLFDLPLYSQLWGGSPSVDSSEIVLSRRFELLHHELSQCGF